jgi:hypothetical protein
MGERLLLECSSSARKLALWCVRASSAPTPHPPPSRAEN